MVVFEKIFSAERYTFMNASNEQIVLGLDIGANSIGWALVREVEGVPVSIVDCGSRIFPAGLEDLEKDGKGSPRNLDRRTARGRRRQLDRREMRMKEVLKVLQSGGLLPEGDRRDILPAERQIEPLNPLARTMNEDPYALRTRALDERLEPFQIGRALYHLARRRGFLSNRKAAKKKDDEEGTVKTAIQETTARMAELGARTYGEYAFRNKSHERRIRKHYTSRLWFQDEFNLIWEAQAAYHPDLLTGDLRERLFDAIFFQRPLKSVKHLIGECELEPGQKRAPMGLLLFQRFRILQDVNNLRVEVNEWGEERPLTQTEREMLIQALEGTGTLSFATAKKAMGLSRGAKLNLERGDRKNLTGNRTAATLRDKVFNGRWDTFTPAQQDQIVEDIRSFNNDEALAKRGEKAWGLLPAQARVFATLDFEDGYCPHSRRALQRLLPLLEEGKTYAEARDKVYGMTLLDKALDILPPLSELVTVRNPIVQRSLSETRKVVNAVLRRHGKPDMIRLELARDLKKNADQRAEAIKRMRANEKAREQAVKSLSDKEGLEKPSRDTIQRVLLAEECGWLCPYTGQKFNMNDLVGDHPRVDIEHIIPFRRSFDDSFMNKTLCLASENRNVKGKKTPWEAYGSNPERFAEIIERVKRFDGEGRGSKLRKFMMKDVQEEGSFLENFTNAQLNDTRYASKLARDYLAHLYGAEWRKHIQVNSGGVTAYLRQAWQLNNILGAENIKSRDDHRHHAVDALVIALTTPRSVKTLSVAASRAPVGRVNVFKDMPLPWEGFRAQAEDAIRAITVSHRPNLRVNGQLHNETHYGLIKSPAQKAGKKEERAVVRKPLASLSKPEIEKGKIVDPAVRQAVLDQMRALGESDPKKAFADEGKHPVLVTRAGRRIPIHRVRVYQDCSPQPVGEGLRQRLVNTSSNYLLAVYEARDRKGNPTWRGEIVSRYEAAKVLPLARRKIWKTVPKHKLPPKDQRVQPERIKYIPFAPEQDKDGFPLKFTLSIGEMVALTLKTGERVICIVQKLSEGDYEFRLHSDARPAKKIKEEKQQIRMGDAGLYTSDCQKLQIDPLGKGGNGHGGSDR
jgi:CRISPR-associated endonuclease Csn1